MFEKTIIFTSLLYSVWCFYFSGQILKERFSNRVKTAILITLTHAVIIFGGRRLFPNGVPFVLVHTASILSIFLWHYSSVKKKVLTYFLYSGIVMLTEMLCMSLFSFIQRLVYHHSSSMVGMVSVQTLHDILLVSALILVVGSLMCKVIADIAGAFANLSSLMPLVQIIFPFYWFCVILSLIYTYNIPFGSYLFLFVAISVPVIPVFISGIRKLRIQEKNRILREKQIDLRKEQLSLFNDQELEDQKLRKWNHDIENHLLSMNYLMNTGKYKEASQYLHNISK